MTESHLITDQRTRPSVVFSSIAPVNQIRQEYEAAKALYDLQPSSVRRFLEGQSQQIAEAMINDLPQVHFKLPAEVVCEKPADGQANSRSIPHNLCNQQVDGLKSRLKPGKLPLLLLQHLTRLEQHTDLGVADSARLILYTTARYLVHGFLPSGHSVVYKPVESEEIPSIPVVDEKEQRLTIPTAANVFHADGGDGGPGRELQVPYVPAARRFYLPQWVVFDDRGHLLTNSVTEAEVCIASMQRFMDILNMAVVLAPYMIADEEYQKKRYGMLGQLVNQGRAWAFCVAEEMIETIKRRASKNDLNRGLWLSLPYFDDQTLKMRTLKFEVIPPGLILYINAFIVLAARQQLAKIPNDISLSASTRKHLMAELKMIETAFFKPDSTMSFNPSPSREGRP